MHPRASLKLAEEVVTEDSLELRSTHVYLPMYTCTLQVYTTTPGSSDAMDPTQFPVC